LADRLYAPTGSRVDYQWAGYTSHLACIRGFQVCPSPESSAVDPEPQVLSPCVKSTRFQGFVDASPAVVGRTETDPVTGVVSTTTYARTQQAEQDTTETMNLAADPERFIRIAVVTRPDGNAGTLAERHIFRVDIFETATAPSSSGAPIRRETPHSRPTAATSTATTTASR